MRKITNKIFSIMLILIVGISSTLTPSKQIYAEKDAPSTKSYVNLANGAYWTDNTSMKYKVYTNVCFTGVSKMSVYVTDLSVKNPNGMRNETSFFCCLYNTSKKTSTTKTLSTTRDSEVIFKDLSTKTKYYIYFVKTDDTKIYSFNAKISNAE